MGLFTIVSAIIFLTFGATVLGYFVRIVFTALPLKNPFLQIKIAQDKKKIEKITGAIKTLEAQQAQNAPSNLAGALSQALAAEDLSSAATVSLTADLYLVILDASVLLLEQSGARFPELPRLEEVMQLHQNLLSKLQEVLQVKARLYRRNKAGEKPKKLGTDRSCITGEKCSGTCCGK